MLFQDAVSLATHRLGSQTALGFYRTIHGRPIQYEAFQPSRPRPAERKRQGQGDERGGERTPTPAMAPWFAFNELQFGTLTTNAQARDQ